MAVPSHVYLIDRNSDLVDVWREVFEPFEHVTIVEGDYFSQPADAIVSPANSFGIMDGGLDRALRDRLGFQIEERLQAEILAQFHGELPIGSALVIPTDHDEWPFLSAAPTMRVPENVAASVNAYTAFRAILLAVERHNEQGHSAPIKSVVCPGLCTGVGGMSARRCAAQMRMAYVQLKNPTRIPSYESIRELHHKLKTVS